MKTADHGGTQSEVWDSMTGKVLIFAEWCVLMAGNRFLDGLEEGKGRDKLHAWQRGIVQRKAGEERGT